MVDFAARITSLTTAILLLFQFVYGYNITRANQKIKNYIKGFTLLRERPGLQNITYSARFDNHGDERLVPSMCKRALQYKDAKVNILLDFMLNLTTLTPLFSGQRHTTAMLDSRTPQQLENIKANKDKNTFKLDIYSTMPMLQMRYLTTISDWSPSVHLIGKTVLFAAADQLLIRKDITYGKLKKASDKVIVEGEFVSIMLSAAKYPFRTCLTIFTRRNGLSCLIIADDMRRPQTSTSSILGLAVILPSYLTEQCQLVVLDTMVHKSEQFVERDAFKVSLEHNFISCALLSKSQAIIFTGGNAILVSLED